MGLTPLTATDETAEAILTAHQRHRSGCLCGWSELGKSHPGHQVVMLREAALLNDVPVDSAPVARATS